VLDGLATGVVVDGAISSDAAHHVFERVWAESSQTEEREGECNADDGDGVDEIPDSHQVSFVGVSLHYNPCNNYDKKQRR
jgi:hypothetical protein